jgi:hypothetical protein
VKHCVGRSPMALRPYRARRPGTTMGCFGIGACARGKLPPRFGAEDNGNARSRGEFGTCPGMLLVKECRLGRIIAHMYCFVKRVVRCSGVSCLHAAGNKEEGLQCGGGHRRATPRSFSLSFLRTKAGMEVGLERGRGGLRATGLDQFELVANQGLVAKIAGEGCY